MSSKADYLEYRRAGGKLDLAEYNETVNLLKNYDETICDSGDEEDIKLNFLSKLTVEQRQDLYELFKVVESVITARVIELVEQTHNRAAYIVYGAITNLAMMWPSSLAIIKDPDFGINIEDYYREVNPHIDNPVWLEKELASNPDGYSASYSASYPASYPANHNDSDSRVDVDFDAKLRQLEPLIDQLNNKVNPPHATAQALTVIIELFQQLKSEIEELKGRR